MPLRIVSMCFPKGYYYGERMHIFPWGEKNWKILIKFMKTDIDSLLVLVYYYIEGILFAEILFTITATNYHCKLPSSQRLDEHLSTTKMFIFASISLV